MKVPLIKENRIEMIIRSMDCIDKYAFNRDGQRDCILSLYREKDEKSVFRGMVIPSLRHLGLIVGIGDVIRLSANAKLLMQARKLNEKELRRVLRAVFLDIDNERFQFVKEMRQVIKTTRGIRAAEFAGKMLSKIEATSERQKEERIGKWLRILEQCGLIESKDDVLYLVKGNLEQAEKDIDWKKHSGGFKRLLFESYASLSSMSAGIVDIADLRERSAVSLYTKTNKILTERQFDQLLKSLPMATNEYIISLGHPMGAEEKLLFYNGNYYRTLSITQFKRGEGK